MFLNCDVEGDLGVPWTARRSNQSILKEISPNIHWKDWHWSWNSNTLATSCEEVTHLKRPWCWERLKAGREGDDRGWDGWMALPTQSTRVWVNSGSWWWTGRPGVLQSTGSQKVGRDWAIELNWTEHLLLLFKLIIPVLLGLEQGFLTSRLQTGTGPCPVREGGRSRRWVAGVQANFPCDLPLPALPPDPRPSPAQSPWKLP